jgi:Zn-dependent M28 family amino/carboxypeptidase
VEQLKLYCDTVQEQVFTVDIARGRLRMYNIIGRINPTSEQRILLLAHWDTRPTADLNPPGKRNQPIQGANDGASGVAVLLELARVFAERPPSVGVDILLTDGEDYGPGMGMMFLGAKHFASQLTTEEVNSYNYGILLDMIGDASLDIHPETHSESPAGRVYQTAYEVSRALGYSNFKLSGAYQIFDDHLPLIERGIRVYNFIDFNYPYWHTTEDTLDKCSPESLEVVGRTVENLVYLYPAIYGPDEKLRPSRIPGPWR